MKKRRKGEISIGFTYDKGKIQKIKLQGNHFMSSQVCYNAMGFFECIIMFEEKLVLTQKPNSITLKTNNNNIQLVEKHESQIINYIIP